MTDAVQIELIRDVSVLLGGVAATMGVSWISARGPKMMLEKQDGLSKDVAEVHKLTNDASTKAIEKIEVLTAKVAQLENAASWKAGFAAADQQAQDAAK